MQLRNLHPHKKGTGVCVNGHVYKIALDGIVRDEQGNLVDVPQVDAAKLLADPDAWRELSAHPVKAHRAEAKAAIKAVLADGSIVPLAPRAEDATKPAMDVSAVMAAQDAFEAKKQAPKDPPIPKAGEDWADPSLDYSLGWLQACAKAYKVKVPKDKNKAALIEKIKAAMYE